MNKAVLITGGSGKVGKQLVNHFANQGYKVVFTSRNQQTIDKMSKDNIFGIRVNLEDIYMAKTIAQELQAKGIRINYLVNNARNIDALKVEQDGYITSESWHREYHIDVVAAYQLSIELAKTNPLEKIVNISSMYGISAFNPHLYKGEFKPLLQYACAKAALIQLTKCMAVMFADKKIAVNCVTYGGIEGRVDEKFKARYANLCPQKRMMHDNETIGAVDFLISEKSAYITGQNIIVDGGWTIW